MTAFRPVTENLVETTCFHSNEFFVAWLVRSGWEKKPRFDPMWPRSDASHAPPWSLTLRTTHCSHSWLPENSPERAVYYLGQAYFISVRSISHNDHGSHTAVAPTSRTAYVLLQALATR